MPEKSNSIALVTGGARRVGRAIVQRLAQEGYDIAFTYLSSAADAESLSLELTNSGRQALAIPVDLTDSSAAAEAIGSQVIERFGRLDVIVNNASIYEPDGLADANAVQMRRMWAVHVEVPALLCQRLSPLLRQSHGHVVNMLDLLAERPRPQYLSYSASKAALWNLTLSLARELAPEVTVNGIAPGVVEWPADYPQAEREKYLRRVPLGRAGTPQDVAETVHFLVSTGSYITGQIIRLDGGRSIT